MADIASTDVTYTLLEEGIVDSRRRNLVQAAFGDGALTYPTGGVPLDKAKMGVAVHIENLSFMDAGNANGFVYKYDRENEKVRIYQGDNDNASDAALIELVGGSATPSSATIIMEVVGY